MIERFKHIQKITSSYFVFVYIVLPPFDDEPREEAQPHVGVDIDGVPQASWLPEGFGGQPDRCMLLQVERKTCES